MKTNTKISQMIVDLGTVTSLTMGAGIKGNEGTPNKPRPVYLQ